jgi:hypothetical protein
VNPGSEQLDQLISRADVDGLIRHVDSACAAQDWEELLATAAACRAAVRTGRQLWPVATLAEYRTALLAPAAWAARVITDEGGRFALGPLTEVVAQHHTWVELEAHLAAGPARGFVAHERVLRGEHLHEVGPTIPPVLDLPLALEPWEPDYPLAAYAANEAQFDAPGLVSVGPRRRLGTTKAAVDVVEDADVVAAVRALVAPWTEASNGRVLVSAVEGDDADHVAGVTALGVAEAGFTELTAPEAMAWLGWAGASGGAHGRRPGAATGRFAAWWLGATMANLHEEWPVVPGDLGAAVSELRWFWWDAGEPQVGWVLQLAVWDPADGVAWAISARDQA